MNLEPLYKFFLLPSGLVFTLLACGIIFSFVRRAKKAGRWLLMSGAVVYAFFATAPISFWLLGTLEYRYPPIQELEAAGRPKPIVLLAAHAEKDPNRPTSSTVSSSTAFRVIETVWLLQKSPESAVIISGYGEGPLVMKRLLVELGVEEGKIHIDSRSASTYESAVSLKDDLIGKEFYLVTSAGHMPRSMAVFRKQGMSPVPAPTDYMSRQTFSVVSSLPTPLHLHYSDLAVHEYLGMLWYKFRGRI